MRLAPTAAAITTSNSVDSNPTGSGWAKLSAKPRTPTP